MTIESTKSPPASMAKAIRSALYVAMNTASSPDVTPHLWEPRQMDVLDRLLPIFTLLIGASLTYVLQRSDSGYSRRLAAGNLLADLRRLVWSKDTPDGWVNVQVYLGRLRVHLREVGVPEQIIASLSDAAEAFWNATEEVAEEGLVLVRGNEVAAELDRAEARVHMWLRNDWRSRVSQRRQRAQTLTYVEQDRRQQKISAQ